LATGDFQDLYTRTLYAAQRDPNVAADVARAKEAVNEAYLSLCDSGPQWSFLVKQGTLTLTINDDTYTYADVATALGVSGITDVLAISFGGPAGSYPGHYARWEDFWAIKQLNLSLSAGVPHLWTTYARSQLEIWPKPQSAYSATVIALQQAPELVNNGDTPLVPIGWRHRLLVPAAAAILLRQESGGDAVSEANNNEALYAKAYEQFATGPMVFSPPVQHPTPAKLLLPAGLQGTKGTFLDLIQRVCYECDQPPWIAYNRERAKDALNQTYRSILDTPDDWDFLEREGQIQLQAGQGTYNISSIASALGVTGIRQILKIVNDSISNSSPLEPMSWPDLESLTKSTQDGETNDVPAAFAVWDGKIRFWPAPAEAYKLGVYYLVGVGNLSADSDVPLIPEQWVNEVLVPLAAARVLYQSTDGNAVNKAQMLDGRGQAALRLLRESRAAAKFPELRLQSPRFSADLPGSYAQDWYF
jgi:hypothetical protein